MGITHFRVASAAFITIELFHLIAVTGAASLVPINKCPQSYLGNRLPVPGEALDSNHPLMFRLRNEFKPCKNEQRIRAKLYSNRRKSSEDEEGLKILDQSYFTKDGLLRYKTEYFYPEEYCINSLNGNTVEATICPPSCRRNRPCVRKCCPLGEVVDMEMGGCRSSGNKRWNPVFHSNETHELSNEEKERIRPHFINLPPNCKYANGSLSEEYSSVPLRPLKVNDYQLETIPMRLLKDGDMIYFAITDKWETIPKDLFCIDGMQNFGEVKSYSGLPSDQIVFTCVDSYMQ